MPNAGPSRPDMQATKAASTVRTAPAKAHHAAAGELRTALRDHGEDAASVAECWRWPIGTPCV